MESPVYYVSKEKPRSHNKNGSNEAYKAKHRDTFNSKYACLYSGLPVSDPNLKSSLVYIHHNVNKGNMPDVDNLSKPIVDAFTGIIYVDDGQIIKREATNLELDSFQFVTVDATNIPSKILEDFYSFIEDKEQHIVLFSVYNIDFKDIKIGEI